jgi:hypothetical protein
VEQGQHAARHVARRPHSHFHEWPEGRQLQADYQQDATGDHLPTFPPTVHCPGDTCPTLTTTVNKKDYISFFYDGATCNRDCAPAPERPLASQPSSSGIYSLADGNRHWQRKPLEHNAQALRVLRWYDSPMGGASSD